MKKQVIRLTENDLHRMIRNVLKEELDEYGWKDFKDDVSTYAVAGGLSAAALGGASHLASKNPNLPSYYTGDTKEVVLPQDSVDNGIDKLDNEKTFRMGESKKSIKITEADLRQMVKESVKSILKEYEDDGNMVTHDDEYDSDYEELTKDKDYKKKMSDTRARNRWKNAGSPKHVSRNYFRDYNDK